MLKNRVIRRSIENGASAKNVEKSGPKEKSTDDPLDGPIKLRREIGLIEAVAVTVGSIVGSGIFVSPKGVLISCGSVGLSLIVWIVCGVLSMSGSLCYAELGTTFPGSGGTYLYLNKAYGSLVAFLFLWVTMLIAAPCTMTILGLTFASYVAQSFFAIGCALPDFALRFIAAVTIIILTFVNCYDIRGTIKAQNMFTITKILALFLIIAFGLVHILQGRMENFDHPFENTIMDPGSISIAFYSGIFSYNGWAALNFMTEELKDPIKTLPRAIYISLPIVTIIYMIANIAYFAVITPAEIQLSGAIAVTFAQKLFGVMACVMPLFVSISTVGTLTINIMYPSRLIFAAAGEGHCPSVLSHITISRRTPALSLIFLVITTLAYLTTSDIFALINISSYVYSLGNFGVVVGMLQMRSKFPALDRPIKVSLFHPLVYLVVTLFAFLLPIYVRPIEVSIALIITLSGWPVYILLIEKEPPKWISDKIMSMTLILQKIFMAVSED